MSLIKTWLLDMQRQQEAIQEARLQLMEYVMFGSLSPIKHDYNCKETTASKEKEG